MSTLEEFENAPVGATATDPDGRVAVKTPHKEWPWSLYTEAGERIANANNHHMATQGYTLDPTAGPSTAREALDLAWNLAHPIREGQAIPAGTAYLLKHGIGEPSTMRRGIDSIASARDEKVTRTLDPLPEPEPEWTNAPAILARIDEWEPRIYPQVWVRIGDSDKYESQGDVVPWQDLRDVTPLWPREEQDA